VADERLEDITGGELTDVAEDEQESGAE